MEIKQQSDEQLVNLIKLENDSAALEELVNRHSGLYTAIVKKYIPSINCSGISMNDIIENKTRIVYEAATSYEPLKGKFNTWLGNHTKFFCLNSMTENGKRVICDSAEDIDSLIDKIYFVIPENTYEEEAKLIFDVLNKHPDPRLSKIFYMRFYLSKPQNTFKYIAKKMNLSQQGVINLYRKATNYLKNHESLKKDLF